MNQAETFVSSFVQIGADVLNYSCPSCDNDDGHG